MADDLGSAAPATEALQRVAPAEQPGPRRRYLEDGLAALMRAVPGAPFDGPSFNQRMGAWNDAVSSARARGAGVRGAIDAAAAQGDMPQMEIMGSTGPLRVWHGSANRFARFTPDMPGPAEGRNYGHGHYFAEDQAVANSYRTPGGGLYDVRLHVDPEAVLDLNAPYAGQSNLIRAIGSILNVGPGRYAPGYLADSGRAWLPTLRNTRFAGDPNADAMVADLLRGEGVQGLRYLDDRSLAAARAAGWVPGRGAPPAGSTYNHVVLPGLEHLIEIAGRR